jgi:hypothetical protein
MQDISCVNQFCYLLGPSTSGPDPDAGSGGSGVEQVFEGRDPAPPDDVTKAALSFPVGGGLVTEWSPSLAVWI